MHEKKTTTTQQAKNQAFTPIYTKRPQYPLIIKDALTFYLMCKTILGK